MNGVLVDREVVEALAAAISKDFEHGVTEIDGRAYPLILRELRAALALPAQAAADAAGAENTLRDACRTLHLYSRRYCDGRNTYAPDDHNRATHALLALGVKLDGDPISKTGPFASDGMYGLTDREHQALARQPWPDADPVTTLRELHALALEASDTKSTGRKVRHARDELVRVCLSLGGDAAPDEAPADEGANIPPEIVEIVTLIGPAQWSRTPAYTPEEHGENTAQSVRLTAVAFNQGDEPQHMQMLVREGTDIVIGYTGTSPHSAQITRALAGAWNHLHQLCVQKAGGES